MVPFLVLVFCTSVLHIYNFTRGGRICVVCTYQPRRRRHRQRRQHATPLSSEPGSHASILLEAGGGLYFHRHPHEDRVGFISGDSVVSRLGGQEEVSGQVCKCASSPCTCNCSSFLLSNFNSIYSNIQRGVEGRNGSEGTVASSNTRGDIRQTVVVLIPVRSCLSIMALSWLKILATIYALYPRVCSTTIYV